MCPAPTPAWRQWGACSTWAAVSARPPACLPAHSPACLSACPTAFPTVCLRDRPTALLASGGSARTCFDRPAWPTTPAGVVPAAPLLASSHALNPRRASPLHLPAHAGYSANYSETLASVEAFDPNTNAWTEVRRAAWGGLYSVPEARMPTHVWGIVAISGCVLCHMAHTLVHSLQQPCLPKASNYLPHLAPPRLCPPCLQLVTLVYYVASYYPGGASGAQSVIGFAGRGALSLGSAAVRASFSGRG